MHDVDRARSALQAIDPACPRAEWLRIAIAAKAAGLSFDDFLAWSESAPNFGNERDCRGAWSSAEDGGPVGPGTLFFLARGSGWQPPLSEGARTLNGHAGPRQEPVEEVHQAPISGPTPEIEGGDRSDELARFTVGAVLRQFDENPTMAFEKGSLWAFEYLERADRPLFLDSMSRLPKRVADEIRRETWAMRKAQPAVHDSAQGQPERGRLRFVTVDALLRAPAPVWRVLRVIPARGLIVIWGASGSGKTFVAIDLAGAILRRLPWAGRRTKRGTVAYIAAEGHMRDRIDAYLQHNGLSEADLNGLRVLDSAVNLLDPSADIQPLLIALREVAAETDGIAVVIIDTLNRVMPGGNENDPDDMGMVIAAANLIERELSCAVVFVHHSGKDETKGSRGHSSLRAAADAEISVRRDGDIRTVTTEKVRDGTDGEVLLTFRLQPVDLGSMRDTDPEADPEERRTSCVVAPITDEPSRPRPTPKGRNQRVVLEVLRQLIGERGSPLPATSSIPAGVYGVEIDLLMTHCEPKIPADTPYRARARINEALAGLQSAGLVGIHRPFAWLT